MNVDAPAIGTDTPPRPALSMVLASVKQEVLARWAARVERELAGDPLPAIELMDHMPAFVDQLVQRAEAPSLPPSPEPAGEHGVQRLRLGFNAGQVVREYGLLHECLIDAVTEAGHAMDPADHRLIARALSEGVADAVSQYVEQRDAEMERQASEHIGFIAHEVRNGLAASLLSYQALRATGRVAPSVVFDRLGRNLANVAQVVDNALVQSWLRMGVAATAQRVELRAFLEELALDLRADAKDQTIEPKLELPPDLSIAADPRLLRSAVSNLLTNALKFGPPGSTITLRARTSESRLLIEVEDQCGGLPPGKAEELFSPLVQKHGNRSGFGLGLAIVQQAAQAHGGTAKVRDLPGVGCVFSLDLPLVRDQALPGRS